MSTTEPVPVAEELFELEPPALVGGRCEGCGTVFFPRSPFCRNPDCPGGEVARALIGRRGRLYSYTRQAYQPPLFAMQPWRPYTLGLVEIPEGLRVLAMVSAGHDDFAIGAEMELAIEPLRVDDHGRTVVTYAYRPVSGA